MTLHTKALNRWLLVQACTWCPVLLGLGWWLSIAGRSMAQYWVWAGLVLVSHLTLLRVLGAGSKLADKVTLARGALFLACAGLAWGADGITPLLWSGICLAVAADLLDGWCARRFGGSEAGAMLDMETDQATTLGLALLLLAGAGVGAWVLLLPAFRYGYVLLMRSFGITPDDPKPCDGDNRRARLICALMMILLLAGLCPWVPHPWPAVAAAISIGLLTWSYSGDVRFLLRRRRVLRAVAAEGGLLGSAGQAEPHGSGAGSRRQLP